MHFAEHSITPRSRSRVYKMYDAHVDVRWGRSGSPRCRNARNENEISHGETYDVCDGPKDARCRGRPRYILADGGRLLQGENRKNTTRLVRRSVNSSGVAEDTGMG